MKAIGTKRRKLNAAVDPWRNALRLRVGKCEWCGSDRNGLAVHEIARGPNRAAALDKPFAVLVLCAACHRDLHELPGAHAVCLGLALLRYNRPQNYHLENFFRLAGRRWPPVEIIDLWWKRTGETK
jgi:hypothetical protein